MVSVSYLFPLEYPLQPYLDFIVNYRSVALASFNYLALLRSSDFPAYHQTELATLSQTRFRFQDKKRPDDYAKWISNVMTWPVPQEFRLSAPVVTWDWDNADGERKIREYLESFRIAEGRIVLMAKAEEHAKLDDKTPWMKEPWYGTEYRVQQFDKKFIEQVPIFLGALSCQVNLIVFRHKDQMSSQN